jgi:ADP-ribose pyrophosphatase YjhB (NUDIX family)
VVHDDEGRLLLVLRGREPARGCWSIPGGRVEPGESAQEAVIREVREETGLDVTPSGPVGQVERDAPGGGTYVIEDFRCRAYGGVLAAGDDADDVAWFDAAALDAVRNRLSPGLLDALTEWGVLPRR